MLSKHSNMTIINLLCDCGSFQHGSVISTALNLETNCCKEGEKDYQPFYELSQPGEYRCLRKHVCGMIS